MTDDSWRYSCARRSKTSTAPSRAACSRPWFVCSATSTWPRRRCTKRFAPRSSSGRATACLPIRAPGSSRPAASRRSTASAGGRASTRSRTSPSKSKRSPTSRRNRATARASRTIGCASMFTCCHPALAPDAQVALTLREVCGLTTEEIAQAFLKPAADAGAADRARQGENPRCAAFRIRCRRRTSCRSGWTACCASSISCSTRATRRRRAPSVTRLDLSGEAIRLGRLLVELLPEPEAIGPAGADAAAGVAARGARRRRPVN